jgi:SAM-dependent methyltransferase
MTELPIESIAPHALFGGLDEETWRWLNLEGPELCPFLARYLPGLPPEAEQARVTARTGEEALGLGFHVHARFRELYEQERGPLGADASVLDFGCGWGRVIRFFVKDVPPERLVGMDIDERAIAAARSTNRWCRFEVSNVLPPSPFPDESFDLVYAYSVFSHLSEEAHLLWLREFERILKSDGVLLLTTLGRAFIERSSGWASGEGEPVADWQRTAASSFPDPEAALAAYDRGEYCYGVIDEEQNPHFGFSAIPEPYVRTVWGRHFNVRQILRPGAPFQTLIACTKPTPTGA